MRVALVRYDLTLHFTTRADDSHATPVSNRLKAKHELRFLVRESRIGKVLRVVSN